MNKSQETELYKCTCGHTQMATPEAIASVSKGIVYANCPSCSKAIILFKCMSCDHISMVAAHTVKEEFPGIVNLTCSKCNKTNKFNKP